MLVSNDNSQRKSRTNHKYANTDTLIVCGKKTTMWFVRKKYCVMLEQHFETTQSIHLQSKQKVGFSFAVGMRINI